MIREHDSIYRSSSGSTGVDRLLLKPEEAAQALGISPRTLWGLDILRVRVGKRGVRYDVRDIRLWIQAHKQGCER